MASRVEAPGPDAQRVVVIGGGFGGLYTALRLESLYWPQNRKPQVTVVDQSERFTFKPLLYDLLNGTATEVEVAPLYDQLLAPYPTRFVQAKVVGVQPEELTSGGSGSRGGGSVELSSGETLPYDYLVVALGSSTDSRGVPGVKELAVPFNTYDDALRTQEALAAIRASGQPATVVVVGGGYAGVELASVFAELVKGVAQVQLVTPSDEVLQGSPDALREHAAQVLSSSGVQILTRTRVASLRPLTSSQSGAAGDASASSSVPTACLVDFAPVEDQSAAPRAASTQQVELVLWTAGASPAVAAQRKGFPFPLTPKGAVETDATLRVLNHERVFAVGDTSAALANYSKPSSSGQGQQPQPAFPATAQVAFQQADYAAWNIWSAVNGRPLLPFRYQHLGNMMALGQLSGAVALPVPLPLPLKSTLKNSPLAPLLGALGVEVSMSDPDNGLLLEGPLAALVRRAAYLYRQPTNEQRVSVAAGWLQQAAQGFKWGQQS